MFIKKPDPTAAKDAQIAQLSAKIRRLEAQLSESEKTAELKSLEVTELEGECPECDDLSLLQCEVSDASYCLSTVVNKIENELCGTFWPPKFRRYGNGDAVKLMTELATAIKYDREHDLAIAHYNLQYCKSVGSAEAIEAGVIALQEYLEANPDLDAKCVAYINEYIALSA